MFNKKMTVVVAATKPVSREVGSETVTDILVTLIAHKQKFEVLNDVGFGDAAEGLPTLLETPLPIKYPVSLAFTPRFDTRFKFPGTKNPMCDLQKIVIAKPDTERTLQLKIVVKVNDVHPDDAGIIVTHTGQTVDLTISADQLELFNTPEKAKKEAKK